ncbi:MAG: DUF1761 domain-containing protein [Flavitalea sp.]
MFTSISTINWLSVLLAFVAYSFLGAMWYLFLFPKAYRKSLGRDPQINPSEAPIFIVGPMACVAVTTIASAILLYALKIESFGETIAFTLVIGVGFLVANTVNISINPNIPNPGSYGMITGFYHLVGITLVNTILIVMK